MKLFSEANSKCAAGIYLLVPLLLASPTLAGPRSAQSDNGAKASITRGVSPAERKALIAIYEATDGPHWKNHDGWLGTAGDECDWYGVVCANGDGSHSYFVVDLELYSNDLKGPVPKELAVLKHLENLTIYGNHLTGQFPRKTIEAWLSGSLWVSAEASLYTDVSEVDFEVSPSSLLCGRLRVILRADGTAVRYSTECRNASPNDRETFCKIEEGKVLSETFARLAWLIERSGFFSLDRDYNRSLTEAAFVSTRVTKDGKDHEVVGYGGGGPSNLWQIQLLILGTAYDIGWRESATKSACPRWDDKCDGVIPCAHY